MDPYQILSMLAPDKPGVFPSQKYFSERRFSNPEQDIVIFAWLIETKQVHKSGLEKIFSLIVEEKEVSFYQMRWVLNFVQTTYCRAVSSSTDLYEFPSLEQYNAVKEKYPQLNHIKVYNNYKPLFQD